jgi:glycosyltransferase involved in cell wall biosynthesis
MKVLFLVTRDPRGRQSGGKAVIATVIRSLVALGHTVDVIAVTHEDLEEAAATDGVTFRRLPPPRLGRVALNALTRASLGKLSLNECLYFSPSLVHSVKRLSRDLESDIVIAGMLRTFELAAATELPLVLEFEDLLSERYRTMAEGDRTPDAVLGHYRENIPTWLARPVSSIAARLLRIEAFLLDRRELLAAQQAGAVTLVSRDEVDHLHYRSGTVVTAAPFAVKIDDASEPGPDSWHKLKVAFVGELEYEPNRAAVRWFVDQVLPLAAKAGMENLTLHVLGNAPHDIQAELGSSRVKFDGYVVDLGQSLRRFPAIVAPVVSGGGVKTKVVEAMALGLPVVSTREGVKGLDVVDGEHCYVADDPVEFIDGIRKAIDDPSGARAMGKRARSLVQREFSAEVLQTRWADILARASTNRVPRRTASGWKWTSSRPRVLFMNDFPMDTVFEAWRSGEFPGQHLYGVSHFAEHGIGVQILPFGAYSDRRTAIKQRFGDLCQELQILKWTSPYDIVYSASQYDTMLLSILRRMGLFHKHIVATMHHMPKGLLGRPSIFRFVFDYHDRLLCLSEDVQRDLLERVRVPRHKLNLVGWAVDLDFYKSEESPVVDPPLALSAGKTKRDYDTLAKAFAGLDCRLEIYCSAQSAPQLQPASNIQVFFDTKSPTQSATLSVPQLLERYRDSLVVAIPLQASEVRRTSGSTSLLEAMAMGRPVVMTTNSFLDIEKERVGIFVEPSDIEAWREAITYLVDHPDEAKEMGRRARRLCEDRFELADYSARIAGIINDVWSAR